MTYLAGYDFDLFVSYAHVNNIPVESADHGWVDALISNLKLALGMKLGRSDAASVWLDGQNLRGNHAVSGHIPEQVKRSALFLAVLSPGYASSEFCLKELQAFIDSRGGVADERLFVVYMEELDEQRHRMPDAFRDPRKYQFWKRDMNQRARILAWPLPNHGDQEDRRFYFPMIEDLCRDIVYKLDEAKASPSVPVSTNGTSVVVKDDPSRPSILLAEVTDDLDGRRDEVRRYLDQAGITTLPKGSYPLHRAGLEEALKADLATSAAFVQLVGPMTGKCPPDIPDGFGWLQFRTAQAAKVPILQWCSPDLKIAQDVKSQVQQALLQTAEAMPFEDFRQKIVRTVMDVQKKKESNGNQSSERPSFIFIDADDVDMDHADLIAQRLGDSFDWEIPLPKQKAAGDDGGANGTFRSADELDEAIATNLIDCDGLLVVYGKAPSRWVRSQLQHYRKLVARRTKEPRVLAVVEAGDEPKEPIRAGLRGLRIIGINDIDLVLKPTTP